MAALLAEDLQIRQPVAIDQALGILGLVFEDLLSPRLVE
jgi:hypothetical protein